MNYKQGQRVRIRKDLKIGNDYGDLELIEMMFALCGMTLTIKEITGEGFYRFAETNFTLSDAMIEGPADCITSPERIQPISTHPEPSRLEIAAMAMMGILGSGTYKGTPNQLSFLCTEYADALIKECNRTKVEDRP